MRDSASNDCEIFDVVIVGAGIAGISAYYYLTHQCQSLRIKVIESKANPGGTWDTFTYPGIRCDSDMHSYGFSFNPWRGDSATATGEEINQYLCDTASTIGLHNDCLYNHSVISANWLSTESSWSLLIRQNDTNEQQVLRTRILFACSGYFSHNKAYVPKLSGRQKFNGEVIVAQSWPDNIDLSSKRVALIGSGATTVSLLPKLAEQAQQVHLIQRSPGYVYSYFEGGFVQKLLKRWLSDERYFNWQKLKNQALLQYSLWSAKHYPRLTKRWFISHMHRQLADKPEYKTQFQPDYYPWQQRLCMTPNGEFFTSLLKDNVHLYTDTIKRLNKSSIKLTSGDKIDIDTIVYATGLRIELFGKIQFLKDDLPVSIKDCVVYKGALLSGMPNFIFSSGYRRNSWTLKTELVAQYAGRIIQYLNENKKQSFTVSPPESDVALSRLPDDFTPNYLMRSENQLPQQGDRAPWNATDSYRVDKRRLLNSKLQDDYLQFSDSAITQYAN